MSNTLICKRCGWRCDDAEPKWLQDEEGRLVKLPEEMTTPHPRDNCTSPFEVGQSLYWDMDNVMGDAPPLLVRFKEIAEFQTAVFVLQDNDWVKESDARPTLALVEIDPKGLFPQHKEFLIDPTQPITVKLDNLIPVEKWPVLEVA